MKKIALALALASGCVSPLVQVKKDLGPIASENMECPEDKLVYEDLQQMMVMTTRVRVKGCGKETYWFLEESRWKKDNTNRMHGR
jgi:hypothetical protein